MACTYPSVSVLVSPRHIVGISGFWTDSWVPYIAWIPRFIEAESFIARACRFFPLYLLSGVLFLKFGASCLFRPCYVPRVRYTCDSIPAFDFLFFFPLYGVLFLCFRDPSILLPFSCAFFYPVLGSWIMYVLSPPMFRRIQANLKSILFPEVFIFFYMYITIVVSGCTM